MRDDSLKLAQEYQKRRNKKIVYLVLFSFGILLLALVACFIGVTNVTPIKLFNTIFHTSIKDIQPLSELETAVLVNIRLCRVTMAVVTGAGLAVCGNIMQSITGNAMASPFTTGVSSAAALVRLWELFLEEIKLILPFCWLLHLQLLVRLLYMEFPY